MITLEMTAQERYLVYSALLAWEARGREEEGYLALMQKVASLPCGSPGCSYCDPQYEVYHEDE